MKGRPVALHPGVQASIDQVSAAVREAYDLMGVNLHDEDQLRAIRATWLLVQQHQPMLPWVLAAIAEATEGRI